MARSIVTKARALLAVATLGCTGIALACADIVDYPIWRLSAPRYDDVGRPVLTPGNDTRINLMWLMRSLHPVEDATAAYPERSWDTEQLGHSFLTWSSLRDSFWPQPQPKPSDANTSAACTPPIGDFSAALAANKAVPSADRATLLALRAKVGCGPVEWAMPVTSAPAQPFLAYLKAAAAFYAGDWQSARDGFAALTHARNPWLAETAAYMPIRIALRQAMAGAIDKWGDFSGPGHVDATQVAAARAAITAYLKAWPHGRYAASAQGLVRRAQWLQGDAEGLAHAYEHLLATTAPDSAASADLVEEIDRKLLDDGTSDAVIRRAGDMPLLQAVSDLRQMRVNVYDGSAPKPMALSAADLTGQKAVFSAHPEIYGFLQATHAYYTGQPAASILAALPAETQTPNTTPLAFSGKVLRGMALASARDGGEAAYWTSLILSARPLYQRPFAELGLAVHWQQQGRLDAIFAAGSPVEDQMTREILLQTIASPAILRAEAANAARPAHERDMARFILLYKGLSRGAYAEVGRDLALVPAEAKAGSLYDFAGDNPVALGLFTHGKWSDGFPCPPLSQTVATLARTPQSRPARLCLGDFWRLNGFDNFAPIDAQTMAWQDKIGAETLGNAPDRFPGTPLRRDAIYSAILADPRATAGERAYALYRAVMCYAPSAYNGCAGVLRSADAMNKAAVPKAQRQAWFLELKQKYPDSPWAKDLRYYW